MKNLLIILFFIPVVVFSQKKDYRSYDKAVSYFRDGEVEKAKKLIEKCIKKNVQWEKPYQLLGKIYEEEGDIQLAVEYYYKGFDKNNSDDQMWWKKIGDLYFVNGEYVDALYHYKSFVEFADKNGKAYLKSIKHIQDCMYAISSKASPVDFNPINMGDNINSENAEYLPFISPDGKYFIFTRRVKGEFGSQEDFLVSNLKD